MLTPRFQLSQDDDFVLVTVFAPHSNLQESDCHIEDFNFIFYATPYFLRLHLPGKLIDSKNCVGTFHCNTQEYFFKLEKENKGEFFENLDMITALLVPTKNEPESFKTRIEVVGSTSVENEETVVVGGEKEVENSAELDPSNVYGYGFGNKLTREFDCDNFYEVFELKKPFPINGIEKTLKRFSYENSKFSSDHYLADLYEPENVIPWLKYNPSWTKLLESKEKITFAKEEIDVLKDLPNKEYLLSSKETQSILIGLVDLLYGLMYEYRTTGEDLSSESSWTVNRLSSTLSWFETFNTLEDCILSSTRRALIYPLYRNFELSLKVKQDVVTALRLGKVYVVKCLIEIYNLFNRSQAARYVLNQLYISDYLVYIQSSNVKDSAIESLANELDSIKISKIQLGLDLVEIEEAAKVVHEEHMSNLGGLVSSVAGMKINKDVTDSDEATDTSSSIDSSDDSDSSSSCSSSDLDSDDLEETTSDHPYSFANPNAKK